MKVITEPFMLTVQVHLVIVTPLTLLVEHCFDMPPELELALFTVCDDETVCEELTTCEDELVHDCPVGVVTQAA